MGQVIVVTSGKHGTGKTTVTAKVGTALAQLGNKVVLVDADIGLRNLDVAMGLENRIVYDLVDVIEGHARLKHALIKDKRIDNLYLLAAAQTREKKDVSPRQMQDVTEQLAREFDFVVLDAPAGIEDGFKNAIAGAQEAIIVCRPEVLSVRDADRVIGLWDAKDENKTPAMLIVNGVRPKMVERGDLLEIDDMLEMLAVDLLGIVPADEHVIVSTNRGEPAVYNKESMAGLAYHNIARRLMGEEVPIMDLNADTSLWAKLERIAGLDRGDSDPRVVEPTATCWSCTGPAPLSEAFCRRCGANLQGHTCGSCHGRMPKGLTFCGACGTALKKAK